MNCVIGNKKENIPLLLDLLKCEFLINYCNHIHQIYDTYLPNLFTKYTQTSKDLVYVETLGGYLF